MAGDRSQGPAAPGVAFTRGSPFGAPSFAGGRYANPLDELLRLPDVARLFDLRSDALLRTMAQQVESIGREALRPLEEANRELLRVALAPGGRVRWEAPRPEAPWVGLARRVTVAAAFGEPGLVTDAEWERLALDVAKREWERGSLDPFAPEERRRILQELVLAEAMRQGYRPKRRRGRGKGTRGYNSWSELGPALERAARERLRRDPLADLTRERMAYDLGLDPDYLSDLIRQYRRVPYGTVRGELEALDP